MHIHENFEKMNKKGWNNPDVKIILILFFAAKLAMLFFENGLWWDSAVYSGMGKYIYSAGQSGLWEPSRPLLLPLMLGFFWKIGLDWVFFGKLLSVLFALGSITLVYLIGKSAFSRKTAFFAALLFSFSPTQFNLSSMPLTENSSTFFLLMGIYFLNKNRHFSSGLMLGISCMARFFQIFFAAPIILVYLHKILNGKKRRSSIAKLLCFIAGILAMIIPYLLLNRILYGNALYPFQLQAFMTKNTGWIFHQPFYFYLAGIIKENFLALFSLLGFWLALKNRDGRKISLLIVFLSVFILYSIEGHKEMRLLIPLLPFLYLFASYGIAYFAGLFRKNKNIIFGAVLILWAAQTIPQLELNKQEGGLSAFQDYIKDSGISEGIWISNPSFIIFSDKKADELIYYPLYNSSKSMQLQAKISSANAVLLNTCDILPCPPADRNCGKEAEKMIVSFSRNLRLAYSKKYGDCRHLIFEK